MTTLELWIVTSEACIKLPAAYIPHLPLHRTMSHILPRTPGICTRRLLRQRKAPRPTRSLSSTTAHHATPPPSPPSSGAALLPTRRLISLHGSDAPKFLQGLLTADVTSPPTKHSGLYSAFLTAQGRVLHDVFLYRTLGSSWHRSAYGEGLEPGYLVEVDAKETETLLKHLKKHKLRSRFTMRLLEDGELGVWSTWREGERWTAHTQSSGSAADDGLLGLSDCRAPGMGHRLLLPPTSQSTRLPAELELGEAPETAYRIRRYLRGVPEGQREILRDDSLPMNCNIDLMGGIDFKKGCYLGQELTIRTHHTGVVRRRVLPVLLYERGGSVPERLEYVVQAAEAVGGKVTVEGTEHLDIRRDDKRKKPTGKLIASVGNVGLGICRLEQMSDLTVSGEGSSFSPDDRFFVAGKDDSVGEATVGVKAFVPDWLRGRIREPKIQRRVEQ